MLEHARQGRTPFVDAQELDAHAVTHASVRRHDARDDRTRRKRHALAEHTQRDIDARSRWHRDRRAQEQAADAYVDRGTEDRELLAFQPAFATQRVPLIASALGSSYWLSMDELWNHARAGKLSRAFVQPEARRPIRRMQAHVV